MANEVLLKIKENHQKILNNTNKLKEKLKKQGKTFDDLHDKLFDNVYVETNEKIAKDEEILENQGI